MTDLTFRISRKMRGICPGPIRRSVEGEATGTRRMDPGPRCAVPGQAEERP